MTEPSGLRPWRETPEDPDRAAQLVRSVADIAPRPVDVARGWDGVIERVAKPKSSRWVWLAAASAAVLLAWVSLKWSVTPVHAVAPAAAVVAARAPECVEPQMCVEGSPPAVAPGGVAPKRPPRPPRVARAEPLPAPPEAEPQPPQHLVAAAGAVWSLPLEGGVRLERGRFEVQPHEEAYPVSTPEVSLASQSARYAADVTEAGTSVRVFEGEVEVFAFAGQQSVTLRAGEERVFAPGNAPSALDIVPPEVSSPACARHSLEQRVACLGNEAKGDGLRAQAALYEAAYLLARAGRAPTAELTLRESLRRFPHGVLHPEVRLALIRALHAQRRLSEAADVAREFLEACPDDPRTADVTALLRTLDWLESR